MTDPDMAGAPAHPGAGRRICLVGATGTIGRATAAALVRRGFEVVCPVRPRPDRTGQVSPADLGLPDAVTIRLADPADPDPDAFARHGLAGERCDAVVSCMASRTGEPGDAWAIEHRAQARVLQAARDAGAGHFVLLSAICVQRPHLAFQHAKLAFEAELVASGLRYSIVRPTAFFKSLSGQIDRVRAGKPFLLFGDGRLTACKPISDEDLADYLADCLDDPHRWNCILPIGGPGPAITPREQGEILFDVLGQTPRFRSVPVRLLDGIVATLALLGRAIPSLVAKAELARIGRYYATESMLVLDPATRRYDAAATPSTGSRTLRDHYRAVIAGETVSELGDHAVF